MRFRSLFHPSCPSNGDPLPCPPRRPKPSLCTCSKAPGDQPFTLSTPPKRATSRKFQADRQARELPTRSRPRRVNNSRALHRSTTKSRQGRRCIETSEEASLQHLAIHVRWIQHPKTASHAPRLPFSTRHRRSAPIEALRQVPVYPRSHVLLSRTNLRALLRPENRQQPNISLACPTPTSTSRPSSSETPPKPFRRRTSAQPSPAPPRGDIQRSRSTSLPDGLSNSNPSALK